MTQSWCPSSVQFPHRVGPVEIGSGDGMGVVVCGDVIGKDAGGGVQVVGILAGVVLLFLFLFPL